MDGKLHRKRCIQYLLGLAAGSVVLLAGWAAFSDELGLRSRGVAVRADVHDWRIRVDEYGTFYSVLYTFTVNGRPQRFERTDRLIRWRTGLWSSVPQEVWQKTRQDACFDVVYLPENPFVNRPQAEEQTLNGPVGVMILGAILIASFGVGLLDEVRAHRWGRIERHYNYYKLRGFVVLFLASIFFGWLAAVAIADAFEDTGPLNVRGCQLQGTAATVGRWVAACGAVILTSCPIYICGVLAFGKRGRIAFTAQGILLPRSRFALNDAFVRYDEIYNLSLELSDAGSGGEGNFILSFLCSPGRIAIERSGFTKKDFDDIYSMLKTRVNQASG